LLVFSVALIGISLLGEANSCVCKLVANEAMV
jgi:hypothetical protein